jgi:Raf kinase inhibitor-like YbhB/YbcL family protein
MFLLMMRPSAMAKASGIRPFVVSLSNHSGRLLARLQTSDTMGAAFSASKLLALAAMLTLLVACAGAAATPEPATPTFPAATAAQEPFTLRISAFPNAGAIPLRYSCDGADISPALSWTSPPPGTATFALIMDDPDAPGGTWDHWTVFNIPASTLELPEGEPTGGGVPGSNSWGETGYGGPCPPSGPAHVYRVFLYALDRSLDLPAGASKREVLDAAAGHILAESLLTGSYGR